MIKEVTMYSVVCDRCGKTYGVDDGIDCWVDICTAREQAMESEWVEIGDKHYCPDCYEFDDELDEYVPKKESRRPMKTFTFDVMLNGRFVCTLKYKYCALFPIDFEDLKKFVFKKRPTLKGKDFRIAF